VTPIRRSVAPLAAIAVCLVLCAPASPVTADASRDPATIIVFAAANTTDPFNDIIATFEHSHPGVKVVPEYAGTQVLATQAEQGAPFDVFISADRAHIDTLVKAGLLSDVALLSEGHEVIVVPKDNPAGITSLRNLAEKNAKLVLGVETVPIGEYTRQILANASKDYGADFPARVLAHAVSLETNVKQVLEKVALGEADGGVVYFTDVTAAYRDKVTIVPVPQRYEVEAANYIALARGSSTLAPVRELYATAIGSTGRSIFRRHGYDPMP
jgi:molybdenum ABC transporter molybdate-binding protein